MQAAHRRYPCCLPSAAIRCEIGLVKSASRGRAAISRAARSFRSTLPQKRVDLLKDMFPKLRRLAVLSNTDHPGERLEWNATQQAAQKLGIEPVYVPFVGVRIGQCARHGGAARARTPCRCFPEGATMVHRAKVAQFAIAQKLPSMFGWSEYCDAGGLLSYGANQRATYFRPGDTHAGQNPPRRKSRQSFQSSGPPRSELVARSQNGQGAGNRGPDIDLAGREQNDRMSGRPLNGCGA